jgi:hypothetical protein
VIVGLVIVQILTISLGIMPITVRQELVSGTIERFLVSAHGPVNGILGTMLFPLINALLSGILMLTLAALVSGLPIAAIARSSCSTSPAPRTSASTGPASSYGRSWYGEAPSTSWLGNYSRRSRSTARRPSAMCGASSTRYQAKGCFTPRPEAWGV